MIKVYLKKNEGRIISSGGLWVFDNEIESIDGLYTNGDIVSVYSYKDDFIAYGYINDNSKIRIRVFSRNINDIIDDNFFITRFSKAWEYRKKVIDTTCCRIVFSESDNLPGLIVDKFNDILVFEIDTLGMDIRKKQLVNCLLKVLNDDNQNISKVYERSDTKVRELEGLDKVKGFLSDEFDTNTIIDEYGVKFKVNITDGQKTGYFLDQKANHYAIRNLCRDAKVLDCCTHTGGFALSAAKVAKEVIGIDASKLAIDQAIENSKLNGYTNTSFVVSDIFDYLTTCEDNNEKFDVVILDPPAFTKSKNSLKSASKGYKEINQRAMGILNDGGILVTCSCSEYMQKDLFLKIILNAGNDAHKRLKLIETRSQDRDHPIILGRNISEYLKCFIFQVNNR